MSLTAMYHTHTHTSEKIQRSEQNIPEHFLVSRRDVICPTLPSDALYKPTPPGVRAICKCGSVVTPHVTASQVIGFHCKYWCTRDFFLKVIFKNKYYDSLTESRPFTWTSPLSQNRQQNMMQWQLLEMPAETPCEELFIKCLYWKLCFHFIIWI